MSEKQPEALRLADALDELAKHTIPGGNTAKTAAELRKQHALNAELVEALEAALIGLSAAHGNRCADMAAHQVRAALSKAKEQ